jgi:two-component system, NtrC family, sensor kinase
MFLEALILFFLLRQLRRTLHTFSPYPLWERRLQAGMIAIGVLILLGGIQPIKPVLEWFWNAALLGTIVFAFREPRFVSSRMTLYAVLPFTVISILSDLLVAFFPGLRSFIKVYDDFALLAAITWMIALLILSQKQLKALKLEHKKRLEEEEQLRLMSVRKAELEAVVAERTAELLQQKEELQQALKDLKTAQAQLIQREKMASLGELTAGIAHEIKNPLNFVNNFSELNVELAGEIRQHLVLLPVNAAAKRELLDLVNDLVQNQEKIHYHGSRADAIVKAMLQHSRKSSNQKEPTDLNALVDEYLRLSYHGLRAKEKAFNVILETHFDPQVAEVNVNKEELGRVLLNLFSNAFYAVTEKKKNIGNGYEPTVQVSTAKKAGRVEIRVKDNGTGIPEKAVSKIYQPFFTTKPTGEGTGLGLSLSYDIVTKEHGGEISLETIEGEGAEFVIQLPAVSP